MYFVGNVLVLYDCVLIDQFWMLMVCVWFQQGKDDFCISVICVQLIGGQYWDNKYGDVVVGVKMFIGVVLGKQFDDGEVGEL